MWQTVDFGLILSIVLLFAPITAQAELEGAECTIRQQQLDRIAAIVGLPFLKPVRCVKQPPSRISLFLKQLLEDEAQKQRVCFEEKLYRLLGLLPKTEDYASALRRVYSGQSVGYYDQKSKELMVSSELEPPERELTVVHELTHALQDQHFDVERILTPELTSDQQAARSALLEGQAAAVTLAFGGTLYETCKRWSEAYAAEQIKSRIFGKQPSDAPGLIVIAQFPYVYSIGYACRLLAAGGPAAINAQFKALPERTSEILHEHRLRRSFDSNLWTETLPRADFSDSLGEMNLLALFATYLEFETAEKAAAGWVSDRVLLYTNGRTEKVILDSHWQSEADADEFKDAVRRLYERRYPGSRWKQSGDTISLIRAEGSTELRKQRRNVRLIDENATEGAKSCDP